MVTTPKVLYRGRINTAEQTVYTVPVNKIAIITGITLCNNGVDMSTLTLSVVPNGDVASLDNRIMNMEEFDFKSSISLKYNIPMQSGDFISGLQGTENAITITISGVEIE